MNGGDRQNMRYTFNLVDRQWIPCVTTYGRRVELGLRELFRRVHELREIRGDSPLETISLYRLVLAVLHRVYGPRTLGEWSSLWNAGRGGWDLERLDDYLNRWYDRFDIFDNDHPFYQMVGFSANRESPVSRLFQELASGNNPTLFDHSYDHRVEPRHASAAARALVAHQTFALGGGRSPTGYTRDAPLASSVAVLLTGDNLFETLMFNLVRYDPLNSEPIPAFDADRPAWERNDPILPAETRPVLGYLDLLTWQSRAIRFIPEGEPTDPWVSRLYYGQGEVLDLENTIDPQVPLVRCNKDLSRLRLFPERAVWRDSTVLIDINSSDTQPAKASSWVATLRRGRILDRTHPIRLSAYGMATGQAKVELWREEHIPLSLDYLEDQQLLARLRAELAKAESVGESLDNALFVLAKFIVCPAADEPGVKYDRTVVRRVADQFNAVSHYWASLEVPFYSLALDLVGDMEEAILEWNASIKRLAWEALGIELDGVERDSRTLKASVNARRVLGAGLARVLGREGS